MVSSFHFAGYAVYQDLSIASEWSAKFAVGGERSQDAILTVNPGTGVHRL